MKKALETPEVQQQMAEMTQFLAQPEIGAALTKLKDDPELSDFFTAIKTEGPQAMMRFLNDEELLRKIAAKIGPPPGAKRPSPQPQSPPAEINNLHEAARWGDLEAAEDFLAIGRDVNAADADGRRPIHYAVAFGHDETGLQLTQALLDAGAKLDVTDSRQNTPLIYASGYGQSELLRLLLEHARQTGCSLGGRNVDGQSAYEIVLESAEKGNPVAKSAELMEALKAQSDAIPKTFFKDA
jgi:ankyrin repeat protein